MFKTIEDAKAISLVKLNDKYFILNIEANKLIKEIKPGQFLELAISNTPEVFLRRPFSIHDVNEKENIIKLLIQIVGKGTHSLSKIKAGEFVNIIYPLGKGFSYEHIKQNALLVGGGCGIAPLLFLAKKLHERKIDVDIIIGVRSSTDIIEIEEYKKYGNVYITTEDGSVGTKGFVTQHEIFSNLKKYEQIYSCGPEAMMKAVSKRAKESNVICEVSLENTMACGIGACLCCITPTINGNLCVCTEGPVFNSNDLLW